MTKNTLYALVYAVLGALKASKDGMLGGTPNGHLYAQAMGEVDIDAWNKLVDVLVESGLITQENYVLKITAKGIVHFDALDAVIAKAEKQ